MLIKSVHKSSSILDTNHFIVRQHAMHAERDTVVANLSVCLSVCPMPVLCLNEWTYRHTFWPFGGGSIIVFEPYAPPLENSKVNHLSGSIKYTGMGKFAITCISKTVW